MRPLELTLRNFRSYFGEESVFDFRGRRLIGIVGPIGSGKTSILDGVSFALYGKTPRVRSRTKSLIHQRADGAMVSLRFEVGGEVWQVVRALRRRGQSEHALYRLAADEPSADREEAILLEGEVNDKITELLGLEFDAFGRSVMLAQGQFARFLEARPGERDKVLKGVFGHDVVDRMREIAKQRSDTARREADRLQARVDGRGLLLERIEETRNAVEDLHLRAERLQKAKPSIDDQADRIGETSKQIEEATTRLSDTRSALAMLPDAASVDRIVDGAVSALTEHARLVATAERTRDAARAAASALAAMDESGEPEVLREARDLITRSALNRTGVERARSELEDAAGTLRREQGRLAAASERLNAAHAGEKAAAEATQAARQAEQVAADSLHSAQHGDMAATLRAGLVPGEPCPVCEQLVGAVPSTPEVADVDSATAQMHDARTRREQAEAELRSASAELQAACEAIRAVEANLADRTAAVAALEESLRAGQAEVDGIDARLTGLLGPGDTDALVDTRTAAYDALRNEADESRRVADGARSQADSLAAQLKAAERGLGELRLQLASVAARLVFDATKLAQEDPASLRIAFARLADDVRAAEREEASTVIDLERRLGSLQDEHRVLLAELDVDGDYHGAVARVEARLDVLRRQIADDEAALEATASDVAALAAAKEQAGLNERLVADLSDTRFIRFLLEEEQARLADLGSDHLERLTRGRYRFTEDFGVIDLTSAEAERRADSLSGGETFLASLGLALALAEMVSGSGGRLDAFFLDEGFGSLDPEHLDLAMDGVEALVAHDQDRLVAVVSHVPELRMRIDDRIELDRDPVTGDTRIVDGASAP